MPSPKTRLTWPFVRSALLRPWWLLPVVLVLVAVYSIVLAVTPERVAVDLAQRRPGLGLRPDYSGLRLFQDNFDRDIYLRYGTWLLLKRIPYKETRSEFPQVATYLFGVPHLFGPGKPHKRFCLSLMMLGFYVALVLAVRLQLAVLDRPGARALLLCLPASVYFAANRFDAAVAAFIALALLMLLDDHPVGAMVFLAFAVLTKGFPIVHVPICLAYVWRRTGRAPWVPALACGAVIAAFMVQTLLWAGPAALLTPYRFQLGVHHSGESFYGLLLRPWLPGWIHALAWAPAFRLLQVAAVPVVLLLDIRTKQQLLDALALVTLCFACFSRVHSPQWMLWFVPLLIVAARGWADLALLAVYDLLTFVYFPLGYDLYDGRWPFTLVLLLHAGLRVAIIVRVGARLAAARPSPPGPPALCSEREAPADP